MRGERERHRRVGGIEANAFAAEACNRGRIAADAIGAERIDGDQKYVERAARSRATRGDEECGEIRNIECARQIGNELKPAERD